MMDLADLQPSETSDQVCRARSVRNVDVQPRGGGWGIELCRVHTIVSARKVIMSDEDLEEQANELLALRAIYGDDAIILPTDVGCTSCVASYSIEIDLELEEPLNVFAPASSKSAPPAQEVYTDVSDDSPILPLDPVSYTHLTLPTKA